MRISDWSSDVCSSYLIGPAGRIDDVIERASKRLEIIVEAALARAVDEQRAIILGEAFGEPQRARRIGLGVIERFEPRGAQPLDVPRMDEFVAQRVELAEIRPLQCSRLADDRKSVR